MIKAVLFDFGGVLTEGGKAGSIARTLGEMYGIEPEAINIKELHEKMRRGHIGDTEFFDELNRQFGNGTAALTKEQFIAASDVYAPAKPVYTLAKQLRACGIKTGILSNFYKYGANELQERGLYNGFDPILLSCDEGMVKPEPEFYWRAVERLGVEPSEIIFVDDLEKCMPPARAMGMHTVIATSPPQIVADVKKIIKDQNNLAL